MGLLATIFVMAASDPAPGPQEPLPWSLLAQPPELTTLESAMGDLKQAMLPSTPILESVRLLESASLGILDVADRIEEYLPEAEAAVTATLRDRGHDPATAAAGAAADRMLAGLRHLAGASRAYATTLDAPDVDGRATREGTPRSQRQRVQQPDGIDCRSVVRPAESERSVAAPRRRTSSAPTPDS